MALQNTYPLPPLAFLGVADVNDQPQNPILVPQNITTKRERSEDQDESQNMNVTQDLNLEHVLQPQPDHHQGLHQDLNPQLVKRGGKKMIAKGVAGVHPLNRCMLKRGCYLEYKI
jgi:hypothetical protein